MLVYFGFHYILAYSFVYSLVYFVISIFIISLITSCICSFKSFLLIWSVGEMLYYRIYGLPDYVIMKFNLTVWPLTSSHESLRCLLDGTLTFVHPSLAKSDSVFVQYYVQLDWLYLFTLKFIYLNLYLFVNIMYFNLLNVTRKMQHLRPRRIREINCNNT